MRISKACMALAAAFAFVSAQAGVAADRPLTIVQLDLEGGGGLLFITPQGRSLLIDTGWPKGKGRPVQVPGTAPLPHPLSSAERIVAALKAAGLKRIDYLLITHYHLDHVGGVHDLLSLIPVGMFIDHGPNREAVRADATKAQLATAPVTLFPKYKQAIAGKKRMVMKPGELLKIDDLVVTVVNSEGAVIPQALLGTEIPGTGCATATGMARDGGMENAMSIGILATYGKARVLSLGDTTQNVENRIVCPLNLIGKVDVMIASHHGSELSNSPALVNSVRPTVVVIGNGATKGGDAVTYETFMALKGLKGLWQVHTATRNPEKNPPVDYIANPEGRADESFSIKILADKNGAVTVINTRNQKSVTYPKSH